MKEKNRLIFPKYFSQDRYFSRSLNVQCVEDWFSFFSKSRQLRYWNNNFHYRDVHYSRLENTHESRNLCNQLCINENDNERNCDPNSSCGALKRIENTNERSRCFWFNASRAVRVTRTPFSFTGEEYSSGFDLETMMEVRISSVFRQSNIFVIRLYFWRLVSSSNASRLAILSCYHQFVIDGIINS